jgi:hypothetical protein
MGWSQNKVLLPSVVLHLHYSILKLLRLSAPLEIGERVNRRGTMAWDTPRWEPTVFLLVVNCIACHKLLGSQCPYLKNTVPVVRTTVVVPGEAFRIGFFALVLFSLWTKLGVGVWWGKKTLLSTSHGEKGALELLNAGAGRTFQAHAGQESHFRNESPVHIVYFYTHHRLCWHLRDLYMSVCWWMKCLGKAS